MIWIYGHHQVPFSIFGHYLEIPLPYLKIITYNGKVKPLLL